MPLLILLILTLSVASTARMLVSRLMPAAALPQQGIGIGLLCLAQIVLIQTALGACGALRDSAVISVSLCISAAAWLFLRHLPARNTSGILPTLEQALAERTVRIAVAFVAAFAAVKIGLNLVNPPLGWDSLNYHLVFPAEWSKNASLVTPITINDDPAPTYYPINGSLVFLWLLWPFRSTLLPDLGQVPFFFLGMAAVYGICRTLNIERRLAILCACLYGLIPNLCKQLEVSYVDLMVGALYLCAVYFSLRLREERSRSIAAFFALSVGLLVGTKTIGLVYAATLAPLFLLSIPHSRKALFATILLEAAGIILIFGGFSYVRNWIQTGNPLYPFDYAALGIRLLKGVVDPVTYRAHVPAGNYHLGKILFREGLGAQTTLLVLPAFFIAPLIAALRERGRDRLVRTAALLLPALIFLAYRFLIPLGNTRYLYPALGIGLAAAFYCISRLQPPAKAVSAFVVLCILSSAAEIANHTELIVALCLSAGIFFLLPALGNLLKHRPRLLTGSAICLLTLLWVALLPLEDWYARNEFSRYRLMTDYSGFWPDATEAWEWLDTQPTGLRIAYVGRPVTLPLYGRGFANSVFYVSVNSVDPAKLHYFPGSSYSWHDFLSEQRSFEKDGNYRGNARMQTWLRNLARRKADILFVYSLHQVDQTIFPFEDEWARAQPGIFEPIFSNDTIRVYRIRTHTFSS